MSRSVATAHTITVKGGRMSKREDRRATGVTNRPQTENPTPRNTGALLRESTDSRDLAPPQHSGNTRRGPSASGPQHRGGMDSSRAATEMSVDVGRSCSPHPHLRTAGGKDENKFLRSSTPDLVSGGQGSKRRGVARRSMSAMDGEVGVREGFSEELRKIQIAMHAEEGKKFDHVQRVFREVDSWARTVSGPTVSHP